MLLGRSASRCSDLQQAQSIHWAWAQRHANLRRLPMKIAVPDLISNSYFPAIAAAELGFFKREGIDVALELVVPIEHALAAMCDGSLDFVGCSAHLLVAGFPEWRGVKLLCAQAQGMYWFLVMRSDLGARRGDLDVVKGRSIGAAHWVAMGLRRLLAEAGIDAERDAVKIAPIPGAHGAGTNFGVTAARALEEGKVDGFWANGMGAELAMRRGVGTIILDARRGDGPAGCFDYTMATLAATDAFIDRSPDAAAAAVRAIVHTQRALRNNVELAFDVGRKLFPAIEAALIVDLIRRDLPYYDAAISPRSIAAMTRFSRDLGILEGYPAFEQIVAVQFAQLWQSPPG
jgi:NitT/TauT family transport system substrate-binding protein